MAVIGGEKKFVTKNIQIVINYLMRMPVGWGPTSGLLTDSDFRQTEI